MTAVVKWQAGLPTGIGHAYLTLHPSTTPVCGQPVPAVHERFAYRISAKCTACLAYESAPVKRRVSAHV